MKISTQERLEHGPHLEHRLIDVPPTALVLNTGSALVIQSCACRKRTSLPLKASLSRQQHSTRKNAHSILTLKSSSPSLCCKRQGRSAMGMLANGIAPRNHNRGRGRPGEWTQIKHETAFQCSRTVDTKASVSLACITT